MTKETGPGFRVDDDGAGVVRVSVDAGWVTKPLAEALCAEIEHVAAGHRGRAKLMLDMGALTKATPGAGMYAMRRLKRIDLSAIALYRASGFMRFFARTVMRLSRFRRFGLFREETEARVWLGDRPTSVSATGE